MTARSISRGISNPLLRAINRRILNTDTEIIRNLLFGQGQQGVFFVPQPVVDGQQRLYKLSDFTDPVTANNDPVGGGQEVSGNDNHLTQSVSADRPTYGTDGTLHWLRFDGVSDFMNMSSLLSGLTTKVVSAFIVMRRADTSDLVLFSGQNTSTYAFIAQSAGTGIIANGSGSPSFFIDGSSVAHRGELHGATADLGWHIWEASDLDLGTWTRMHLSDYIADGFDVGADVADIVIVDESSPINREKIRNHLADKYGITL